MHLDLRTREVSPGRSDIQAAGGEGGGSADQWFRAGDQT